jgi:hypothetical protein
MFDAFVAGWAGSVIGSFMAYELFKHREPKYIWPKQPTAPLASIPFENPWSGELEMLSPEDYETKSKVKATQEQAQATQATAPEDDWDEDLFKGLRRVR